MLHLPKPLLSANLYCDGHLDEVVHGLLAPFWTAAKHSLPHHHRYLWFIRYARCGEHLKLRLHAPIEYEPAIRCLLETMVPPFFAGLGAPGTSTERKSNMLLPPIDPEDRAECPYPDRTLLWTHYEPSPITVGAAALLPDERYLTLFTLCLSAGTDVVLEELAPDAHGEYSWRMRQNLLIKLVLAAFADLPLSLSELCTYFHYHRDWLVRYLLYRGRSAGTADDLVAKFDQRAQEMTKVIATLREVLGNQAAEATIDGAPPTVPDSAPATVRDSEDDVYATLGARMANLFAHVVRYRSEEPAIDPYAPDQAYLPIFKCLHGLANQLGLGMPKEAQIYHLLAIAAGAQPNAVATAGPRAATTATP